MKRSTFLTYILSRAVSGVRVTSATVIRTDRTKCWFQEIVLGRSTYWIQVDPDHSTYWKCFKEAYPNWEQVARRCRTLSVCPEFYTKEDLIEWLANTLNLSRGERKLLFLCEV